jgi:hypothetical protein
MIADASDSFSSSFSSSILTVFDYENEDDDEDEESANNYVIVFNNGGRNRGWQGASRATENARPRQTRLCWGQRPLF